MVRAGSVGSVAVIAMAFVGCAHLASTPDWTASPVALFRGQGGDAADLPGRSELVAGQLVIHADFPLAGQHRLVKELEAMRADVSQDLGLPISDEPVHLYLFENPSRYEAFVAARFPAFPARRAFFVETDTTLSVFAAWQDRVAEDLRHETTHGYVHAVVPTVPLWLDEGIAEYFELPRANRGLHPPHVAHLAGRMLEGTWQPDMARLEALQSAGEMSQDHYAEAWCWVHWLLSTTPDRRALLQDYLAGLRRDVTAAPLSARLRAVSGDPAGELREHLADLAALDEPR
ncbi:MAG: hypothetical protein RLZZ440_2187 [Planctomycetota bacterium]